WPWLRIVTTNRSLLPTRLVSEGLLFGSLFLLFAAWRLLTGRTLGSLTARPRSNAALVSGWIMHAAVAAMIVIAIVTHAFRQRVERQLDVAERLLDRGQYAEALQLADAADGRWLSAVKPGRI